MVVKFEGRQAWLALLCSSLSYTLMAIPDGSYAILYDYLIDIYNANRTSIGWALSLYWISIYMAGKN
ncbi:hypothetical protein LSH36_468g03018 [Paralvinella palmiformis]|uniref:Uncharacterized protein n=1 Tax=Paralvinella palmiformis TaxID=53620 RepID=A0AAD9JB84_9ANNE|nr:hypothetical protein LSH36_468g03018 [Paralvinella palmiformis]